MAGLTVALLAFASQGLLIGCRLRVGQIGDVFAPALFVHHGLACGFHLHLLLLHLHLLLAALESRVLHPAHISQRSRQPKRSAPRQQPLRNCHLGIVVPE